MNTSPYHELPISAWEDKTKELIEQHPLNSTEIYEVVLKVWAEIFESNITSGGYRIGVDFFPRPQIMGYFLHELIPLEFSRRYPNFWRREQNDGEKDLVYIPDPRFSIEIKTSSSARSTYGNRSYAQTSTTGRTAKKRDKSGYYLVINFQKFDKNITQIQQPKITLIRFGWIDGGDWKGKAAATGQQAKLSRDVERYKLLSLPL